MKYANTKDLITAVRAYAERHYEQGGFDILVECWTDADIEAEIGKARTLSGALRKLRPCLRVVADYRAEVRAESF